MLKNYLKLAWRNIARHKAYSFINILGLSIGLSACLVIFLLTHFELSTDTFHPEGQRIYRLISKIQRPDFAFRQGAVPPIAPFAVRQTIPGLEAVASWQRFKKANVQPVGSDKLTTGDKIIPAPATIIAEPQYFSIFSYHWLAGSPATALNAPFKVVLTKSRARIYFGNIPPEKAMGRVLVYNDSLRVTLSGIVEDWTENSDFSCTDIISFSTINNSFLRKEVPLDQWGRDGSAATSIAFVRLAKNVDPARVNRQLTALSRGRIHFDDGAVFSIQLQPLADIHYDEDVSDYFPKAHRPTLYALMGIAAFILLLAVINFINLSTAMAIRRAKEVGVRKVLGGGRSSIILQFLFETAMLTVCALIIAMLAVQPLITLFHSFLPSALEFHPFTPPVLLFLLGMTIFTTLLSGLYPAKVLSTWLPVLCLKGTASATPNEKGIFRKSLIVFQFAISLLFIICTLVIGRQINYMRTQDLGFSTEAILNIDTNPGDTTQNSKRLALLIQQIPGVDLVAREAFPPATDMHTGFPVTYKGKHPVDINACIMIADDNFIPLYHIRLLAGTPLRNTDTLTGFVVNEAMTRAMGLTDPREAVGKMLYGGDHGIPIIGVVADFHEYSYHENIVPIAMMDFSGPPKNNIAVRLNTRLHQLGQLQTVLSRIEQAWKKVYPGTPFNYSFLDDAIAAMYTKEEKTAVLMNTAMILTIFISCMGLFGLAMFTAGQRKKEVGIRKVLGATVMHITLMLSGSFARLIAIAVLIASPIAWYLMTRWLQDFVYRIHIGGLVFFLAGGIALSIAMLTIGFQTLKLAFTNPAEILRSE